MPPIFSLVAEHGGVSVPEMRLAFNMGLGLVVVVPQASASDAIDALTKAGERATRIGEVIATPGADYEARVVFG